MTVRWRVFEVSFALEGIKGWLPRGYPWTPVGHDEHRRRGREQDLRESARNFTKIE